MSKTESEGASDGDGDCRFSSRKKNFFGYKPLTDSMCVGRHTFCDEKKFGGMENGCIFALAFDGGCALLEEESESALKRMEQ